MMIDAPRARKQLLALVMASHNRCGAASPARHFVSQSALSTAPLWDLCLRDTEVVFGFLELPKDHGWARYSTFALSSALSSVTRDAKPVGAWRSMFARPHAVCPIAVDPAQVVVAGIDHRDKFSLLNVATQRHCALLSEVTARLYHYGNSRWWVHCDRYGDAMFVVDLTSQPEVTQHNEKQFGHTKIALLPQCGEVLQPNDEEIEFMAISFSKLNPDEAVVMVIVGGRVPVPFLLRIDVRKTHSTGKLAVLSLTKCQVERRFMSSTLIMRKSNGDLTFICQFPDDATSETVYEVAESVGTFRLISSNVQCLSQLTASLFCILKDDQTVEVWDCSSIDGGKPLRVLRPSPGSCNSLAIGQSGFIFCKQRTKKTVDLSDTTGFHVGTINFPKEFDYFTVTSL